MSATTAGAPLLELRGLSRTFQARGAGWPRRRRGEPAVCDVDLCLREGETLALVGESGAGKTTVARCAVRLLDPSAGAVLFRGTEVTRARGRDLRALRSEVQMTFQDAGASLNPRRRAGEAIAAAARIRGADRTRARMDARELLARVGLRSEHAARLPHQLSGGERQRVAIARALATSPRAVVLDEPVSALDAPVRARIVDLLADLREENGLAYLLISHDLGLVRRVADRVSVMWRGRIVESGTAGEVLTRPSHRYTQALVAAAPRRPRGPAAGTSGAEPLTSSRQEAGR